MICWVIFFFTVSSGVASVFYGRLIGSSDLVNALAGNIRESSSFLLFFLNLDLDQTLTLHHPCDLL